MIRALTKSLAFFAALAACFPWTAQSDELTLLIGTKHTKWNYEQPPQENNPGAIITMANGFTVGAYLNSFDNMSSLIGYTTHFKRNSSVQYHLVLATATGYDKAPLVPMALGVVTVGYVSVGLTPTGAFTLGYSIKL